MNKKLAAHPVNALLIALILWTLLLFAPGLPLTDGGQLAVSGVLCGMGLAAGLWAAWAPELPRLPHERGRMDERRWRWFGLALLLGAGALLALEAGAMLTGHPPMLTGVAPARAISLLTAIGGVFAVLPARMQLCWNKEGFTLRTALGHEHRFGWEAVDSFVTSGRGGTLLCAGHRYFVLPGSARQVSDFIWYAHGRRKDLGLPELPTH